MEVKRTQRTESVTKKEKRHTRGSRNRQTVMQYDLKTVVALGIRQGGVTPPQSGVSEGADSELPLLITVQHTHISTHVFHDVRCFRSVSPQGKEPSFQSDYT